MAAGATYEPIATTTLGSLQTEITFSSIPATYTDIVLIFDGVRGSGPDLDLCLRFNGDTGNNYSVTALRSNGSSAISYRQANQPVMTLGVITLDRTILRANVMNYSNTVTYKTVLGRQDSINSTYGFQANVGLWRDTSAINSITIRNQVGFGSFETGCIATLYGISAA
jgi:hypothetical protein